MEAIEDSITTVEEWIRHDEPQIPEASAIAAVLEFSRASLAMQNACQSTLNIQMMEETFIRLCYIRHKGQKTRMSQELGMVRSTLRLRLRRMGLV